MKDWIGLTIHLYDAAGNITKVTDALGTSTTLGHDCLGRVISVTDALGNSKHFEYDAVGNITALSDEAKNTTRYTYSVLGELIKVTDALGHETKYGYDKAKRLTKIEQLRVIDADLAKVVGAQMQTDPTALITTYERNLKGEITAINSPMNRQVHYSYDALGQLTSKTDEDGCITTYEYNPEELISKVEYADGRQVEYEYSALRQLRQMKDWLGITTFDYDELGRMTKTTNPNAETIKYLWSATAKRTAIIYPDESITRYAYDKSGKLMSVVDGADETTYSYDVAGRMLSRVLSNGVFSKYTYDPLGNLSSLAHTNKDDILDQINFAYDSKRNKTEVIKQRLGLDGKSNTTTRNYTYDVLGRLSAVLDGDEPLRSYSYDSLGNRTVLKDFKSQVDTLYLYNDLNQLIESTASGVTTNYSYDLRGNMISSKSGDSADKTFTFDATNKMVSATTAKGTALYTYDGLGRRVGASWDIGVPSAASALKSNIEKTYLLDALKPYDNVLALVTPKGTSKLTWGNELLTTTTLGLEATYHLHDELRSPMRTIAKDETSELFDFDEFGVPLVEHDTTFSHNPFSFTGYEQDPVTDLHFAQARYYMPEAGRFTGEDIIKGFVQEPQTLNPYVYCGNDPIRYIDLDGLSRQDAVDYINAYSKIEGVRNPAFPSFESNCTNFTSQCLLAGGVDMISGEWYVTDPIDTGWVPDRVYDVVAWGGRLLTGENVYFVTEDQDHKVGLSDTWNVAAAQYEYFSDPSNGYINGEVLVADKNTNITCYAWYNNVQPGDLVYWVDENGAVGHATIVSDVYLSDIYIAGNSNDYNRDSLTDKLEENGGTVHIVRLNDSVFDDECG